MYRWFRKIVALDHASAHWDDVLFWMDCDCYTKRSVPLSVLDGAFRGAGVVHMRGNRSYTETGLVGYDMAVPAVRTLIDMMKEHYLQQAFRPLARWDDCITLDLCLRRQGAPASRDLARRAVGHGDVLPTTVLAPYFEHDKGLHSRGLGLVS